MDAHAKAELTFAETKAYKTGTSGRCVLHGPQLDEGLPLYDGSPSIGMGWFAFPQAAVQIEGVGGSGRGCQPVSF